ncbi:EpsG family protein [Arundinibacter roseus]|uniref:EpsG family protein n=1 Tax=Arundinibacter roseus TaxID=2070510 RepID=A0A4R4K785_9BACT|nr:EpsG family protein [Arundinibacter roseus]
MILYLLVFLFSTLCTYLAFKTKDKVSASILLVFAFLAPVVLAGCRNDSVGTDVLLYGTKTFYNATQSNTFLQYYTNQLYSFSNEIEVLYLLLNFVVTRFTNDFNIYLFIVHFILMTLVYLTAYDYRDSFPPHLFILIFFLLYFNESLCFLRQAFSVVLFLYSYKYVLTNKPFKYYIFVLLAIGFHNSALLLVVIYPLQLLINSQEKHIFRLQIIVILVSIVLYNFYAYLVVFMTSSGILSVKYNAYIMQDFKTHKTDVIFCILIYFLLFLKRSKIFAIDNSVNILRIYLPICLLFILMGSFTDVATRVADYLYMVIIIVTCIFIKHLKFSHILIYSFIIVFLLINYIYLSLQYNHAGTIPYTSSLLNIK